MVTKNTPQARLKPESTDVRKLLSEIGLFVAEFEDVQTEVKIAIKDCFDFENLDDGTLVDILLYKAHASDLSEYFKGIVLHQIFKMDRKATKEDEKIKLNKLKELVKLACKNLNDAATFRNDLLHASWGVERDFIFKDDVLDFITKYRGKRAKIKTTGIKLSYINLDEKVLSKVVDMLSLLKHLINLITMLITSKGFKTFKFSKEVFEVFETLKIESERNKLYVEMDDYYEQLYNSKRKRKEYEEYDELVRSGAIKGGD